MRHDSIIYKQDVKMNTNKLLLFALIGALFISIKSSCVKKAPMAFAERNACTTMKMKIAREMKNAVESEVI